MGSLPLRKIHGIGPATEKRLQKLNFHLCRDLWPWSMEALEEELGNMGPWLYDRVRGIDERPVTVHRERKSLGKEETFSTDILDLLMLDKELVTLCESLELSLKKRDLQGKTIVLKVKYSDFNLLTRSYTLADATNSAQEILDVVRSLMRVTEAGRKKIRLLGVSLSNLSSTRQPFTLTSQALNS